MWEFDSRGPCLPSGRPRIKRFLPDTTNKCQSSKPRWGGALEFRSALNAKLLTVLHGLANVAARADGMRLVVSASTSERWNVRRKGMAACVWDGAHGSLIKNVRKVIVMAR